MSDIRTEKEKKLNSKIQSFALDNLSTLITKLVTEEDRTIVPASGVLLSYMQAVVEMLATSAKIEQNKMTRAEADEVGELILEACFSVIGDAFGVDVTSKCVKAAELEDITALVDSFTDTRNSKVVH